MVKFQIVTIYGTLNRIEIHRRKMRGNNWSWTNPKQSSKCNKIIKTLKTPEVTIKILQSSFKRKKKRRRGDWREGYPIKHIKPEFKSHKLRSLQNLQILLFKLTLKVFFSFLYIKWDGRHNSTFSFFLKSFADFQATSPVLPPLSHFDIYVWDTLSGTYAHDAVHWSHYVRYHVSISETVLVSAYIIHFL